MEKETWRESGKERETERYRQRHTDTQRMTRNTILAGLQWAVERKEEEILILRLSS